ncbi:hypothetical protein FMZ60_12700 [Alcaligenaceae bacterium SJ-26]|nr:hypothetical protein FMZ60_12700 [Alcaligenaceae bacterium SJ-26]
MKIPPSMRSELDRWNGGKGIDLESWIGCEGNFSLAIGYAAAFWPEFEDISGYILRAGTPADLIQEYEKRLGQSSRHQVEATLNHIHIADLHGAGCPDIAPDKLQALGQALQQMTAARLAYTYPDRPCTVDLQIPDDPFAFNGYTLTFWQASLHIA